MHQKQLRSVIFVIISRAAVAALITLAFGITVASQSTAAQTYQVIHNFTNGGDGGTPPYALAKDSYGHFFGTANTGGRNGDGIVFKLAKINSSWVFTPLYNFTDEDGQPGWGVTLDPNGSIYTNAEYTPVFGGPCGSALLLRPSPTPPPTIFGGWSETLMHTYVADEDGYPTGNLVRDPAGNLYGVTQNGGPNGWGAVFELSRSSFGAGWRETILYAFQGGNDGGLPYSELILDSAGNLYGTASARGAFNYGIVFELSPSQSGWTETVLYAFQGGTDGAQPVGALIFDSAGNLYGTTTYRGSGGGGTAFELTPSGGGWNFNLLASFTGSDGPIASLILDSAGNLYGTTFRDDSYGYGSVFKLTHSGSGWTYTDLHDFTGGSDGGYPGGGVVFDASGKLYGTAVLGGANGFGVVYEITP